MTEHPCGVALPLPLRPRLVAAYRARHGVPLRIAGTWICPKCTLPASAPSGDAAMLIMAYREKPKQLPSPRGRIVIAVPEGSGGTPWEAPHLYRWLLPGGVELTVEGGTADEALAEILDGLYHRSPSRSERYPERVDDVDDTQLAEALDGGMWSSAAEDPAVRLLHWLGLVEVRQPAPSVWSVSPTVPSPHTLAGAAYEAAATLDDGALGDPPWGLPASAIAALRLARQRSLPISATASGSAGPLADLLSDGDGCDAARLSRIIGLVLGQSQLEPHEQGQLLVDLLEQFGGQEPVSGDRTRTA